MRALISVVLGLAMSASAQQRAATVAAQSSGACSPNILSNQGKVEFTCNTPIDAVTATKIVSLLNQILKKESSATNPLEEINHKVDEILAFVRRQTPRSVSDEDKANVSACLSKHPGKVNLAAITNSPEAYRFAQDWYEVFKNAGWTIKDDMIHSFMISGGMWTGTQVSFHGEWIESAKQYRTVDDTPEASLIGCLKDKQFAGGATLIGYKDTAIGEVNFFVGPQPQP